MMYKVYVLILLASCSASLNASRYPITAAKKLAEQERAREQAARHRQKMTTGFAYKKCTPNFRSPLCVVDQEGRFPGNSNYKSSKGEDVALKVSDKRCCLQ